MGTQEQCLGGTWCPTGAVWCESSEGRRYCCRTYVDALAVLGGLSVGVQQQKTVAARVGVSGWWGGRQCW
jgi:hypothetical protein